MIHIVTAAPGESLFLRACRREPVPATPVWFMRQAGRSLPEYRAVRDRYSMLAACTTADIIAELTLQPLRRFPVDAAILFSDIVVPLRAVGLDIDIKPGVGPVTAQPFRGEADVARLRDLEPGDVPYITEAVATLVKELGATPLIGFAGAPFTLASYLIEGGPSKNHERTRALMYGDPVRWRAGWTRARRCRATWTPPCCWPRGRCSSTGYGRCSNRAGWPRGMCSTSA